MDKIQFQENLKILEKLQKDLKQYCFSCVAFVPRDFVPEDYTNTSFTSDNGRLINVFNKNNDTFNISLFIR